MSVHVVIKRSEERDPGTGKRYWRVIDNDAVPSECNYWGLLADGCGSVADAIACAVEHGWIAAGGDSADRVPRVYVVRCGPCCCCGERFNDFHVNEVRCPRCRSLCGETHMEPEPF